jgi:hypothetical protein
VRRSAAACRVSFCAAKVCVASIYAITSELFALEAKTVDTKLKAHKMSIFVPFYFCEPKNWLRLVCVGPFTGESGAYGECLFQGGEQWIFLLNGWVV